MTSKEEIRTEIYEGIIDLINNSIAPNTIEQAIVIEQIIELIKENK